MKFHVITFGCQMNVGDSDWLSRSLVAQGLTPAPENEADIFVVNTCSVREKPELKVYSILGRLAEYALEKPDLFIAVGGCVAQQIGTKLWQRFPLVRLVFGADGLAAAPQAILRLITEPGLRISLLDFTDTYPERQAAWPEETVPAQAFVTIMQGCDNFCAYCIVPFVRGRQKSRQSADVVAECRELAARGAREITLLGQNVNSYGLDASGDGVSFATLLHRVAAVEGIARLRFTTSHPKDLSPEVIAAFAELPALCPSLHLPLQSGSDAVLRRMGRKYDAARYLRLVEDLKKARPDISLSTDIIVGFPGETEEDFQQTMDMVRTVGFESGFSFMYNDRPGVAATRFAPKIPVEIKAERLARLQVLLDDLHTAALAARVGTRTEVLVEGASRKPKPGRPSWRGREPGNRVVDFEYAGPGDPTGTFVTVDILEAKKHSLRGKAV
ncbi:tRNA (N6-isopentenyl adenosine(37)-C2)-methylthiotransferase MiaB [Desulfovibrio sulfodismutans]|uniref:tRNA-2-methylthio-N(6)-dimethylallyladenosine synthase n=1 Tax=Desulfolutivibrio sulfodismutans TaxID=63561 RepID=A0A7K3NS14_9BACT|nr:tRNA (N6-isopentenyl adenosine(37)-C2)-methylthiotransferase MiaB [Desulfolutivibrio sulfodismutans]NDY58988.1 tRNA (N6-isopentenyl adenosine(37)-C2)-methylthiotransferase MiaB [Desulfolutivibrio sulfodismutans]QLA11869.1 tRNA (N6-isopentenyl adenosine(37)-C2)-methylthiotransferase MiaB [Desulfolutivibrio sulfodismutans DSM 3696]